jgi:hypothetical protein
MTSEQCKLLWGGHVDFRGMLYGVQSGAAVFSPFLTKIRVTAKHRNSKFVYRGARLQGLGERLKTWTALSFPSRMAAPIPISCSVGSPVPTDVAAGIGPITGLCLSLYARNEMIFIMMTEICMRSKVFGFVTSVASRPRFGYYSPARTGSAIQRQLRVQLYRDS